ncbi:MAG: Gfo/Idh/MocA family oxidoreductase, partial [Gemmatimonadetes bacterium]|nr:Gfo/Idh/MocA family oxidoreductase [Gemmatimonadota bacterium]
MAKNKQDKLRVALIGAGGIAGSHMRYYQDMDDVEMVAAADVVLERAQKSCEEYENPAAYADYEEMLRQVEPDAVSVCTPNGLHAPCSIAALNAGAHVLVEKPVGMN